MTQMFNNVHLTHRPVSPSDAGRLKGIVSQFANYCIQKFRLSLHARLAEWLKPVRGQLDIAA